MNRTPATIGVLILVLAILAALSYKFLVDRHQDATHSTPLPVVSLPLDRGQEQTLPSSPPPVPEKKETIYVVSPTGGDENGLIAQSVAGHPTQSPALDVLNALAKVDNSPLPVGTQIRGVKIADGLATVDFTREFQANFHGGDTQEAQTVNSVLRTLGQFPTVDRVQILVEGKPIDALSQLSISGPLDVIRPETVRQAQGGGH